MRVVHITPYFAPAFRYGGPPRSVLGLCQGLQAAGVEVEVITTTADGPVDLPVSRADGDVVGGVPVRYLPAAFPRRFFGARFADTLNRAFARADLCHIHGLWNVPEWRAAALARTNGLPYVLSPRGMLQAGSRSHHRFRKQIAYRLLEQKNVAGADRLHATSPDEARELAAMIDHARVVMIPNGVDVDRAHERGPSVRARLGIAPADPVVTFLGRLHPIKRIDLLAAAMVRVRERFADAHLVLAGPDEGGHLAALQHDLSPLGRHVHALGAVDDRDKWTLLAETTALALCSDSESFGLAAAEALAAGVPVVATRTVPWEALARESCGFWVEQRADAIADALSRLIADPVQARAMGERATRLAQSRYSWSAVGHEMAACYADVLSTRRAVA